MATSASHPVGYRFHPTEEELIGHYLKNKIKGHCEFNDVIREVDICSCEPWDLPGFSLIRSDDEEWFFFSRPDYKTKGNSRNRATEKGFWKITGMERVIKARRPPKAVIGKKRTLTFYIGKVRRGQKTAWVIHEYYIPEDLLPDAARQRDFVLCRLKKKDESSENGSCDDGEVCQTSTNAASDFQHLMANFGRPSIPEDLQITPLENDRPEEIVDAIFSSHESPQSPEYFAPILRAFLDANADNDDNFDREFVCFEGAYSDQGGYSLEDIPRTTLFNHSSEPLSTLREVYDEGIHQQGLSVRDTNVLILNHLLQKTASSVNVAANLPRKIGYVLQAGSSSDTLSSAFVTDQSSLNETGRRKGEMITTGAELQSGPQLPLRPKYIPESKAWNPAAQSTISIRQGFKPQEVKYTSKAPEKPKEAEKPRSNDEQKSMKQKQTETSVGDWKSSFIVWKESPLSLESCPPVEYIRNMIGGLVLSIFFVGELISYGKW